MKPGVVYETEDCYETDSCLRNRELFIKPRVIYENRDLFIKPFIEPVVSCFLSKFYLFVNQKVFSVKIIWYSYCRK